MVSVRSDWAKLEKRELTTPHAAQCHARAVAVTSHPSLQLPKPTLLHEPQQPHDDPPVQSQQGPEAQMVPEVDLYGLGLANLGDLSPARIA